MTLHLRRVRLCRVAEVDSSMTAWFLILAEIYRGVGAFASTHEKGTGTTIDYQRWRHYITSFFHLHPVIPPNLRRMQACIELRSTMAARDSVCLPTIIRGVGPFDSTDENRTGSAMDHQR